MNGRGDDEDQRWHEEMMRRVQASRRRDQERKTEAARRAAEESQRQGESQQLLEEARKAAEARALLDSLHPRLAPSPLDGEPVFPGAALPTLVDYVRVLKALSAGDPVHVIAAAGLDMSSWSAEVTAWGQAMLQRHELGLRFSQLLSAPWS